MGTRTVLFTDVPDSTRTFVTMGDAGATRAMADHLELLESVAAMHGGAVAKTLGDGVMALFDSVADGLHAAVAMQQVVYATFHEGEGEGEGVGGPGSIRIGIHVGDVQQDDRDDLFGATVIISRRLCDECRAGQILASHIVPLMLGSDPGLEFAPVGPLQLKGLPAPVEAVEVMWEPRLLPTRIRVVVAEDAALIRDGIVRLLTAEGFDVVADVGDHPSLIAAVDREAPDLVITDIRMPPDQTDEGLRAAAYVKANHPGTAVLVLSQHVAATAAAPLLSGQTAGVGYLLKERVSDIDQFLDAARRVVDGDTVIDPLITEQLMRAPLGDPLGSLSDREHEVLALMAQGLTNQAICDQLYVSPKTVESHVRSIFQKLHLPEDTAANRRVQAVVRWLDESR